MSRAQRAQGAGEFPLASDEGHGAPLVEQAMLAIEGEDYARAYLDRLSAGNAAPGELAVILGFLRTEMLRGACRVIEKALAGVHRG